MSGHLFIEISKDGEIAFFFFGLWTQFLDLCSLVARRSNQEYQILHSIKYIHKASIYYKIVRRRTIRVTEFRLQFQSFFAQRDEKKSEATKHYKEDTSRKGIQRTPPYLTYIGDSIDQGATRLGGLYINIYVCRWGLPFFCWLFSDASLDPTLIVVPNIAWWLLTAI